jgi:hypothetical protein
MRYSKRRQNSTTPPKCFKPFIKIAGSRNPLPPELIDEVVKLELTTCPDCGDRVKGEKTSHLCPCTVSCHKLDVSPHELCAFVPHSFFTTKDTTSPAASSIQYQADNTPTDVFLCSRLSRHPFTFVATRLAP